MQKMNYEFTPHIGAGPIKFGMSPKEVHAALNENPTRANERNSGLREDYSELGINYDENRKVAEICFFPETKVTFKEQDLLSSDPNVIIKEYDNKQIEIHGFLVYPNIGVNTCGYHDGDDSQRAFNVFRSGYWDNALKAYQDGAHNSGGCAPSA
ncbi:Unannotated [Lentimonas sp. CC4]|nr:Unannotated [Lentimonas sp. CC4]CAA6686124.1 Unannotated [Lentimonas sp. CC6]CAA7074156.1 Unannotated [Lentimonas sp. CC4]CAA7171514.1 Unannotated [Lentimonas sp. CC21]CAA7181992.1 Unannotated [Lentimonas sp. CC8]